MTDSIKTKILVGDNREVLAKQEEKFIDKEVEIKRVACGREPPLYSITVNEDQHIEKFIMDITQKDMKEFVYKLSKLVEV